MRLINLPIWGVVAASGLLAGGSVLAENTSPPEQPTGRDLYEHWCADCHDPGPGHPGTMRMEGDFGAENSVLRDMTSINRPLIHFAVRRGFNMMPPFRPTEITDEELERIADYILEAGQ